MAELQIGELFVEVIGTDGGVLFNFKLGDNNAFQCIFSLRATFSLGVKVQLRDDKSMVCPALCNTHGLFNRYILPASLPDDGIINEMPVWIVGASMWFYCGWTDEILCW